MDVRVRCCGLGPDKFAADGSHIGETVVRNYLESKDYKLSVEGKLTMGYLTHRGRSLESLGDSIGNPGVVKKVIGRDDAGLCVGENLPTFTHYVKEFYVEDVPGEGPFLMALVHIFDEKDFDQIAAENIRRLKGLIRSGVRLTCSLVVLAFWNNNGNGIDEAVRIKAIKSLDWTINPSFGPLARITEVIDDENQREDLTKTFSEIENDSDFIKSQPREGEIKVKTFSDLNALGCSDMPKSSKIDGQFCIFRAKEFSSVCSIVETLEDKEPVQKMASEIVVEEKVEKQKEFSAATLRERLRYASPKFSPRMRFRRLFIDYKQLVKQMGGAEKMDPDMLKTLKSLFLSDMNQIFSNISQDIKNGKQIGTLIGASSLGKNIRVSAQKLQMPYRLAFQEMDKTGKINPARFQKMKEAYTEFAKSMVEEVFGATPLPEGLEEEANQEEKGI